MEDVQKISGNATEQMPLQSQSIEVTRASTCSFTVTRASTCRFPGLVHKMLNSADPSVVTWIEHGEAFIIKDMEKLGSVLEQHFQHKNYSSFQRQLNMYGWKKYSHGRFKGAFHHPHFHREKGCSRHFAMIKRKGPPLESTRKRKPETIGPNETSSSSSYRPIKFTIQPNFNKRQVQFNQYSGTYHEKNISKDISERNDDSMLQREDLLTKAELEPKNRIYKSSHIPLKKRSLAIVLEPRENETLSSVLSSSISSESATTLSSTLGSSIKVLAAAAAVFRDLEGKTRIGNL